MQLENGIQLESALANLIGWIKKEPHVIRLILFGSHARGDANKSSDIDLLVIVDEKPSKLKTCKKPPDMSEEEAYKLQTWGDITYMLDGKDTDVIIETPSTIKLYGKIYGCVQYYAIRKGMTLYERADAGKLLGSIEDAGHDEQAEHWIAVAETKLKEAMSSKDDYTLACFRIYESITASVKTMLAYERINYKFTRDLNKMYRLLPDRSEHDLTRASKWRLGFKPKLGKNEATEQDVADGIKMATEMYDEAKNKCMIKIA